jgi:hypothetical protein
MFFSAFLIFLLSVLIGNYFLTAEIVEDKTAENKEFKTSSYSETE